MPLVVVGKDLFCETDVAARPNLLVEALHELPVPLGIHLCNFTPILAPPLVTRAACRAGVTPFDMPGFDWFAEMDAVNVEELGWALEGEDVLARNIERVAARMLERVADDPSKMFSDNVQLSEADRAQMANPERHEAIRRMSTRRSATAPGAMSTTSPV